MFDRLDDILIRFEELLHELGDPVLTSDPEKFRRLMKEQAELAPLVETYKKKKKTLSCEILRRSDGVRYGALM